MKQKDQALCKLNDLEQEIAAVLDKIGLSPQTKGEESQNN